MRLWLAAAATLFALLLALPATAHTIGVSRGEYRRVSAGLEVSLVFAQSELAVLEVGPAVTRRIDVRSNTPCSATVTSVRPLERDGLQLDALFRCSGAGRIRVSLLPLLRELSRGHRHEAIHLPSGASTLLFEAHPELVLEPEASPVAAPSAGSHTTKGLGFVRLGIEHILTGFDHLVFLLGLVVVGLGTRRTIVVASAFTLAHSLSLVACTLGAWTPPSSVVEPAIALSIVYVGIENLVARSHERRAWLAFAFGLVHGLGFASALSDVEFHGIDLFVALAGFNVGVELGQLFVLALLLPLIGRALVSPTFTRYGLRAVSVGVAAAGALWFVTRVVALA